MGENVTLLSQLEIGDTAPLIQNIDIEQGSITLNPNTTKLVNCSVIVADYNGDTTITNVSAELFDNSASAKGNPDDNNDHYTNDSCVINYTYGDENTVSADCLFELWYYANPGTWNCSVQAMDQSNLTVNESNTTTVQALLALAVPDSIDYGTVNATEVSGQNTTNITNVGNVMFNISFLGYGVVEGDNLAMNCTLGSSKNISVEHEKYNLTASNDSLINFGQFDEIFKNLSSSSTINEFNLDYRTQDGVDDVQNETYWRIYVPLGVAGSCQGNIIFGAIQSPES